MARHEIGFDRFRAQFVADRRQRERFSADFCTQRPGLRALNETKRGLGSSNKGMCSDLVAYFNQIAPYFAGGEETFTACRRLQIFVSFPLHSSMNSKIGFSMRLTELQTLRRSRQASIGF